MTITGQMTLNGLHDSALIILIEAKKSGLCLGFDPTAMKIGIVSEPVEKAFIQLISCKDVTFKWVGA